MHNVELQSMIAATTEQLQTKGPLGSDTSGFTFGGKETEISSTSLWDEEE